MRVLVCGSRDFGPEWTVARDAIVERLRALGRDFTLIHGAANGADSLADGYAKAYRMEVLPFPADWKTHGRRAGPLRNQQMLDEGKPDLVLAFHTDPGLGRGTADMVRRARMAGVRVETFILGADWTWMSLQRSAAQHLATARRSKQGSHLSRCGLLAPPVEPHASLWHLWQQCSECKAMEAKP